MSQINPNFILSAKNNLRNRNDFSYMAVCQFNAKVYVSNHKLHIRLIEKLPIVILRGHLCKSFVWAIKNNIATLSLHSSGERKNQEVA